jgi:N-acetylglucosamine-6-phosphate deacetylase
MQKIINGKILTPARLPDGYGILIEGEQITMVAPADDLPDNIPVIDAKGHWVIPGLIDIHIHGSHDHDTMDEDPYALRKIALFLASRGVTSFLPTTVTSPSQEILAVIEKTRHYQRQDVGARLLGIHLEGPYLNAQYRGAQLGEYLRTARPAEYLPWLETGLIKLMTVAPEVEGVFELIKTGSALGVKFAVGHSAASYEQVIEAVNCGLNQSTHTFNAMSPLHHRQPGVVGAVLTDDRIYAQVIADGVHLHPAVVKLLVMVKRIEKTILITDAIQAAGAADGVHQLGKQSITVKDGIARTESGALAGSTLTLNDALRNSADFTGLPWQDLLPSATIVPAKSLGLEEQIGVIKAGTFADIVIMNDQLSPELTIVAGEIIYQAE